VRVEGSVILTASGSYVDPLDLDPDTIDIRDVAHALANQCRFSGHVSRFYSVAEHSVRVAGMLEASGAPEWVVLWGLLHDATEAYLVDLPSPLKGTRDLGRAYLAAESRAQDAVADAFGLPRGIPEAVKAADLVMLATERRDLMPAVGEWAILDGVEPLPTAIVPASPDDAKAAFLEAFEDLVETTPDGYRPDFVYFDEAHSIRADRLDEIARDLAAAYPNMSLDDAARAIRVATVDPTPVADGFRLAGEILSETKATNPKDAVGSDKLPLHLWPASATVFGSLGLLDGMLKYGRANWREAGVRATIYLDALERHAKAWAEGEERDPDSGLPHLAHALACLAILVDARATGKLVDDRQYNGAGYRPLVEAMTPHVARLKAKHADKSPRHFTIADEDVAL
jgi:5'-deoxynucleotidase YfbR-like HD superfamily hydrolase